MTMRNEDLGYPPSGIGRLLDAFCGFLAKERPLKLLLVCSLAAGCIFCLCLFDIGFLLGTSAYWENPRGIVGNGWGDISTALSGYMFFQHDTWQWPLFHVDKLGAPSGTNIIFTDSIPWVALAGRLIFRMTGVPVILYGVWTAFCFIASAMTLTVLVATLGQRSLAAAAMATVAGLCMPALLARWGHMSLMAQFEIPLALIFYLRNNRGRYAWLLFAQGAALMWLSLWTHTSLFAMVGAIVLATIAQAVSNHTLRAAFASALVAGLTATIALAIWLSGYLQSGGLGAEGVGVYSTNLLSPFLPQYSGLFAPFHNLMVDATGGQYEGFSYLGVGVLMLLLMTLPWQLATLRGAFANHPWMCGLFFCFTIFALSNIVYFGPLQILHIPLPERILQVASNFRSTGRFFWPVMYTLTVLAIAAPISFYGQRGVLLLCLAIPLQWIDSAPLRQMLAISTRAPEKPHLDLAAWQSAIRRHASVRVLPQYDCLAHPRGGSWWDGEVAVQLQLLAAQADRPINSVYKSRPTADCSADLHIDGTPRAGTNQLSVFLDQFPGFSRLRSLAATRTGCLSGNGLDRLQRRSRRNPDSEPTGADGPKMKTGWRGTTPKDRGLVRLDGPRGIANLAAVGLSRADILPIGIVAALAGTALGWNAFIGLSWTPSLIAILPILVTLLAASTYYRIYRPAETKLAEISLYALGT